MPQTNNSASHDQQDSLFKRMIVGAGLGLLIISVFVIPAEANPAWGKFWMIRPLIINPLSGALGGLCGYYLLQYHEHFRISKFIASILSVAGLILALYLGFVLGLDGTLWD